LAVAGGVTVQPIELATGPGVGCCHSSVPAMASEARGDVSGVAARFAGIWACSSARLVASLVDLVDLTSPKPNEVIETLPASLLAGTRTDPL
jgi:hypothetical protein